MTTRTDQGVEDAMNEVIPTPVEAGETLDLAITKYSIEGTDIKTNRLVKIKKGAEVYVKDNPSRDTDYIVSKDRKSWTEADEDELRFQGSITTAGKQITSALKFKDVGTSGLPQSWGYDRYAIEATGWDLPPEVKPPQLYRWMEDFLFKWKWTDGNGPGNSHYMTKPIGLGLHFTTTDVDSDRWNHSSFVDGLTAKFASSMLKAAISVADKPQPGVKSEIKGGLDLGCGQDVGSLMVATHDKDGNIHVLEDLQVNPSTKEEWSQLALDTLVANVKLKEELKLTLKDLNKLQELFTLYQPRFYRQLNEKVVSRITKALDLK